MSEYQIDVITGIDSIVSGRVCFPDRGDEVTEDSIIVIPHGGAKYHVEGMKCKAIITEIGNRLCHLAIVTREQRKTIVRMPNAMELLKDQKYIVIDCENARNRIKQMGED